MSTWKMLSVHIQLGDKLMAKPTKNHKLPEQLQCSLAWEHCLKPSSERCWRSWHIKYMEATSLIDYSLIYNTLYYIILCHVIINPCSVLWQLIQAFKLMDLPLKLAFSYFIISLVAETTHPQQSNTVLFSVWKQWLRKPRHKIHIVLIKPFRDLSCPVWKHLRLLCSYTQLSSFFLQFVMSLHINSQI